MACHRERNALRENDEKNAPNAEPSEELNAKPSEEANAECAEPARLGVK